VGLVVLVREHSFRDDSRENLLRFLNDVVCGVAESIDKSVLKQNGMVDLEHLLDGKLLRKHVDTVLNAIDSIGDPIEREGAFLGVLQIAMASINIGMGGAATAAKRRNDSAILAALSAKRSTSDDIDRAIAALAGPLETKHPTWSPSRVANEIADALNRQLAALNQMPLGPDAIRKRVQRRRTNVRASDKKRTDAGRSK
jgi:hypothetical protein